MRSTRELHKPDRLGREGGEEIGEESRDDETVAHARRVQEPLGNDIAHLLLGHVWGVGREEKRTETKNMMRLCEATRRTSTKSPLAGMNGPTSRARATSSTRRYERAREPNAATSPVTPWRHGVKVACRKGSHRGGVSASVEKWPEK